MQFARLANTLVKDEESARDNHVLACNFAKYLSFKKFSDRLSNKPFLIWLLTTTPHLKIICSYTVTLLCNLSLMSCFANMDVSQGSVATYARWGWIFNIHLTANLPRIFQLISFWNRLRFERIMVVSLWPHFFDPPCTIRLLRMECKFTRPRQLMGAPISHVYYALIGPTSDRTKIRQTEAWFLKGRERRYIFEI